MQSVDCRNTPTAKIIERSTVSTYQQICSMLSIIWYDLEINKMTRWFMWLCTYLCSMYASLLYYIQKQQFSPLQVINTTGKTIMICQERTTLNCKRLNTIQEKNFHWNLKSAFSLMANSLNFDSTHNKITKNLSMMAYVTKIQISKFANI